MAIAFKHTGSLIDLTSVDTNPDAAPMSTPRQGGFTLRNRFGAGLADWLAASQVTGASSAIADAPVAVMNVPPRTVVNGLSLYSVPGESAPDVNTTLAPGSCSLSDSDYVYTITFYAQPILKKTVSSGVTTDTYADASSATATMGTINLAKALSASSLVKNSILGTAPIAIPAVESSATTPYLAVLPLVIDPSASNAVDAGSYFIPRYFPHGGRILCQLGGTVADEDAEVNATTVTNSGVWEMKAKCDYVPE